MSVSSRSNTISTNQTQVPMEPASSASVSTNSSSSSSDSKPSWGLTTKSLLHFRNHPRPRPPSPHDDQQSHGSTGSSFLLIPGPSPVKAAPPSRPSRREVVGIPDSSKSSDTSSLITVTKTSRSATSFAEAVKNQPRGTTDSVYEVDVTPEHKAAQKSSNHTVSHNSRNVQHKSSKSMLSYLNEDPMQIWEDAQRRFQDQITLRDAEIRKLKEENARLSYAKEDAERKLIELQIAVLQSGRNLENLIREEFTRLSSEQIDNSKLARDG